MSNENALRKIIAAYTPWDYTKIDLTIKIEDKYIATEFKNSFCNDICERWPDINATALHNDMFDSLRTGEDILEIIKYNKS